MLGLVAILNCMPAKTHAAGLLTLLHFSHDSGSGGETFQGNAIRDEEVWTFNPSLADGSEITGPFVGPDVLNGTTDDIDAFTISGGKYYFSVQNGTAVTVEDGATDLATNRSMIIEYDPNAALGSRASVFYDPNDDTATSNPQTDAVSFHSDGNLLLSFDADLTFGGIAVEDGDVVKFDPADVSGTISVFFDEDNFQLLGGDDNEDIVGFEFVREDIMYILTGSNASLNGATNFDDNDIVRWNSLTSTAFVELESETHFDSSTGDFKLNAIYAVPEPRTYAILAGLGLLVWGVWRRYQPRLRAA